MPPNMSVRQDNPFLHRPIGRLLLVNALPMAVVLSMGGVLNLVDGVLVGRLIGPQALAAVSLAFPVFMLISALSTLVGSGMSSLLSRALGAGDLIAAADVFAGAHGLALVLSIGLIALTFATGPALLQTMAAGNPEVAALAGDYLFVLLLGLPVQMLLAVHADALRSEGQAAAIAMLSILVNLANIGANWLGIAVLGLGIAGSALGTVAAQLLGLILLVGLRGAGRARLPLSVLGRASWFAGWRHIVILGLPVSLSLLGIAFGATVVMLALRAQAGTGYDIWIAAYGAVTRILGFAFLPQMAIALASQSISGNNAGAGLQARAEAGLRMAMAAALIWCLGVTGLGLGFGQELGAWFSTDPEIAQTTARILVPMLLLYAVSGPVLVLGLHLQAMGRAGPPAVLMLVKPWVLTPLLVTILSGAFGLSGIWLAFPIGDAIIAIVALAMFRSLSRNTIARHSSPEGAA